MLVLFVVLTVAQGMNLALLVGERSLIRKNDLTEQVFQTIEDILLNPPDINMIRLPYSLPDTKGVRGAFFYSRRNRADKIPLSEDQPKLSAKLRDRLEGEGITVIGVTVTLLPDGPHSKRGFDRPDGRRLEGGPERRFRGRPGGPSGEASPSGRRRPPPFGGPPPGERQPFRPPKPPSVNPSFEAEIQELLVSVEVTNSVFLNAMVPHYPIEKLAPRIFMATGFLLILTLLVSGFFIRRIVLPYGKFTESAKRLGRGEAPIALAETGPDDVRTAAIAFNRMQDRLTRLIESQRTMLRAVGHDLRTPLTAMRIDVDNMDDDSTKYALMTSINEITAMTEDILGWVKDLSGSEDLAPVNLGSFLHALVEPYERQGDQVRYVEGGAVIVKMRRVAMRRALRNLIDNGVRYAGTVRLRTETSNEYVTVLIEDDGPGIPEADLDRVIEPFIRLEESRNKETGGTGLGLSIARSVIQTDGGQLILENRPEGGLRVRVVIPR